MTGRLAKFFMFAALTIVCADAFGIERFPPPEFDTYQIPQVTTPEARGAVWAYIDVAVLAGALGLSAWLSLKKRDRRWIYGLMIFSLAYFGFFRKGCVCPIGAIGNVSYSLFSSDYAIPFIALIFFVLPLVFALFFGRIFCSAVCPLGAIQDAVVIKPVAVPGWLERGLRVIAYAYLGLAVLFASTGSAFIICRYDPFVGFFRLSGSVHMIVLGLCFLVVGMFVGRAYCRFFCPYGVLLRLFSRVSRQKLTITPDDCINCRLCENACPYGAIDKPTVEWSAESYGIAKKRLTVLVVLLPVLVAVGCLAGYWVYNSFADESEFLMGSVVCGGFIGLVVGLKLIGESIRYKRTEYEANKGNCYSCGRCFKYCPKEKQRLKNSKTSMAGAE